MPPATRVPIAAKTGNHLATPGQCPKITPRDYTRVENGPWSVSVRVAPTILVRPSVRGASRWSVRPSATSWVGRPWGPTDRPWPVLDPKADCLIDYALSL